MIDTHEQGTITDLFPGVSLGTLPGQGMLPLEIHRTFCKAVTRIEHRTKIDLSAVTRLLENFMNIAILVSKSIYEHESIAELDPGVSLGIFAGK